MVAEIDKQVVEVLVSRLEQKGKAARISYGNLADEIQERFGVERPNPHTSFNHPLGRIQEACFDLDLPCLSVMVVDARTMRPGKGFIPMYINIHPELANINENELAKREWDKVSAFGNWQPLLDYYGIDKQFAGPKDIEAEIRSENEYKESQRIIETIKIEIQRNSEARRRCLELKGSTCVVCGFNSEKVYGVSGIIHIHHLKPLSERFKASDTVETNPETDLVPVCPNCHALIHSKKIPGSTREDCHSIEEAREMVKAAKMSRKKDNQLV